MKLELVRQTFTDKSTIGSLSVDGQWLCWTLEDKVREIPGVPVEKWKKQDITAIPRGTYKLVLSYSERFQKVLPLLIGVPGFTGVRIHSGNTSDHTEGCILVGSSKAKDFIGNSRATYDKLDALLKATPDKENITITVR